MDGYNDRGRNRQMGRWVVRQTDGRAKIETD
jgi:hypothetical protein